MDWGLVQSFLAVVETGSLSAAGRKLGQSQPTIGRHIKEFERQVTGQLFRRAPKGLEPTELAINLLPFAQNMALAAAQMSLGAAGSSANEGGTVRITASIIVSHFVLPRIIEAIRREHPEIQIELVATDQTENLLFRDADIAIRMYRPEQLDVITKHVGNVPFGLFAASHYLDRVGRPETIQDIMSMDFIGFDKNDLDIRSMRAMGIDVTREFFAVRCDDQAAYWHLVCAGCGIGGAQLKIGQATPGVEQILPEINMPALPMWLAAPEALRQTPIIRKVWDALAHELGK